MLSITITRKPKNVWVDRGHDFYNTTFEKFLKDNNINMYSTNSKLKSSVVERFNRTILEKIFKKMGNKRTYINDLHETVPEYNNTVHFTTNEKPINITKLNADKFKQNLFRHNLIYLRTLIKMKIKLRC